MSIRIKLIISYKSDVKKQKQNNEIIKILLFGLSIGNYHAYELVM
jgi:hypothetical protein